MANAAKMDQVKRTVEVDRHSLIDTLEENRAKHIKDYEESMEGYKTVLLDKINKAFDNAKKELDTTFEKMKSRVSSFTDEDISKQQDHFVLVDYITVEMRVPRSYVKEYDAAIDMAKWDVRKTLELTHAEFTCFVRDQWDWKSDFETISTLYKAKF
jgi:hypothetical protein